MRNESRAGGGDKSSTRPESEKVPLGNGRGFLRGVALGNETKKRAFRPVSFLRTAMSVTFSVFSLQHSQGKSALGDFTGFNRLYGDQHTFDLTAREKHANALQVGPELPFGHLGDVGSDAATFLGLPLPVNDAAFGWAFPCDLTNSGHDVRRFELNVKE